MNPQDEQAAMTLLRQRLQAHRHKLTAPRQELLRLFLARPDEHLSAEEVHRALRRDTRVGLATVYRNLELLSLLGLLQGTEFGDGCTRYELGALTPREHQHHHVICLRCGKVLEYANDLLEPLERDIAEQMDFYIIDHQVKFYGYCAVCRDADPAVISLR